MPNGKLKDKEAKAILLKWPSRTKSVWPAPGNHGFWLRGQPKSGKEAGPTLSAPGAQLFKTQPDGLWVHFSDTTCCDVIVVEVVGTAQNLNDKRSRYMPASHSLILTCPLAWLEGTVAVQKGGQKPRWVAAASITHKPTAQLCLPVRHLRALYALPNDIYAKWVEEHTPTGYEYFCPHSSLDSYTSPAMQKFLGQMSVQAQFYAAPQK